MGQNPRIPMSKERHMSQWKAISLPRTIGDVLWHHVYPIVGYVILTIGFTYPTAFRLTTHIPGGGDAPWFLWQLWWFKHALVDLKQSPLITDMIYYPLTDVPVTWQTPINEFFTIPFQMVTGVVVLYNLLFLASFVLSGYFMYLLLVEIVQRRDLAFVGGLVFAFCAYRGVRGLGHLSLLTTQWMPLALLLLIRAWRRPTVLRGIGAGIAIGMVSLSSPYYLAYFVLPLALVGGFYVTIWQRPLLRRPQLWSAALAVGLVAGLMILPFYISFLQADQELLEEAAAVSNAAYDHVADLLSWFLPPGQNPVWGRLTGKIYSQFTTPNLMETTLFFGLLPLILAFASAFVRWPGRRQVVFWQLLALLTWVLSFGPVLHVHGQPLIEWMPYRLFMALPGAFAFRIPSRIGIVTVIAATVLCMMMLERCIRKRPGWRWRALLAIWSSFLLASVAFRFPYTSSSAVIPPVYERIANTPGKFAILELPAGELFFGQMSWYMYYQTYHNKRLVSGYLGRRPPRLHATERELPFVRRFFTNDPSRLVDSPSDKQILMQDWPEDVQDANTLLYNEGIRYVILHCPSTQGDFCQPATALLTLGLGPPIYRDESAMLYEVAPSGGTLASGLGQIGLSYDDAYSEPFIQEGRHTRTIETTGTINFTVPLRAEWSVYGELQGSRAEEVQFAIDGQTMPPQILEYSQDLLTFRLKAALEPTHHRLLIRAPESHTANAEQDCSQLCIRNLAVRLDRPAGVEVQTTQTFNGLLSLTSYSIQEIGFFDQDIQAYILFTEWSCHEPLSDDYTLYLHYVDDSGELLAQDDHLLGRGFSDSTVPTSQWECPGNHADVSYVPEELLARGVIDVAFGLWRPETNQYAQPSGELRIDQLGRTRLEIRLDTDKDGID